MRYANAPVLLVLLVVSSVLPRAALAQKADAAREVAVRYLRSLTGEGEAEDRELLLGGATLNAQMFMLDHGRILSRDPIRREKGDLAKALSLMRELDDVGRQALTEILGGQGEDSGVTLDQLSREDAARIMGPTKERARRFLEEAPVLAYVARVDREVYWHPQNPLRAALAKAGKAGTYELELHLFHVESLEGPRKTPRKWPLRVLRLRANGVDTGWRVLPASDWNAE